MRRVTACDSSFQSDVVCHRCLRGCAHKPYPVSSVNHRQNDAYVEYVLYNHLTPALTRSRPKQSQREWPVQQCRYQQSILHPVEYTGQCFWSSL